MALFDFFKKTKQLNNSEPTFEEILMPARTEPQPPFFAHRERAYYCNRI